MPIWIKLELNSIRYLLFIERSKISKSPNNFHPPAITWKCLQQKIREQKIFQLIYISKNISKNEKFQFGGDPVWWYSTNDTTVRVVELFELLIDSGAVNEIGLSINQTRLRMCMCVPVWISNKNCFTCRSFGARLVQN